MANSRQSATIFSPSSKRPTKRTRSSITEHSFQSIASSPRGGSVTYVSGTNCHPCVGSLIIIYLAQEPQKIDLEKKMTMPLTGRQAESDQLAPYATKVQPLCI